MSDTIGIVDEPKENGSCSNEVTNKRSEDDNDIVMDESEEIIETEPEVKEKEENEKEEEVTPKKSPKKEESPESKEEIDEKPEINGTKIEVDDKEEEEEKEEKDVEKEQEERVVKKETNEEEEEETKADSEKVKEELKKEDEEEEKEKERESKKDDNEENEKSVEQQQQPPKKKKDMKQSPKKRDKEKNDGKENIASSSDKIGNREHALDHVNIRRDAANRVKLYVLCDQRIWEDRGTGHVVCVNSNDDELPSNSSSTVILVRLEGQPKNMLESRILMDTVYQKQQETLIVWSETDVMDLALSFQEKSGCEELWTRICEVQGRDPGDPEGGTFGDDDEDEVGELTSTASRLALPAIEIGRLSEIDALLHMHLTTNTSREKMANAIEAEDVIKKLCDVYRMCEDIEHVEGLRAFYSIGKNLFMLNRNVVIELLLDEKHIRDVIGFFEYDPAYKHPRKHREFVYEKAKFREVLHISSDDLKDKIHRLYRAQYIQDACLPSLGLFEENLLSTLNSYIFFCRVDIVTLLQKDKRAMRELFGQLKAHDTEMLRRRDMALFLKEMISLSQNLPQNGAQSKDNFFKNIFNNDILEALEPCMKSTDTETRSTMVEILKSLVDHNPQVIRDYLLKQAKEEIDEDVLLNRLINHMLSDADPHLTSGTEVIMIMKTLLDPENMPTKSAKEEFLSLFYHRCIQVLLKPLLDNVSGGVIKKEVSLDDYTTANRLSIIIRLLTFCVEHHNSNMRQHCVSTDLLNKFLILLKSKHQFAALYALKLLQRVVTVKDDYYVRYIIREKVLDPVFDCFKKNGTRYNVINSAILHLFDFIKSEDIRPLIKYIVENHMETIEAINYVKTFKELKIRYDQHRDREETMSVRSEDNAQASPSRSKKDRQEDQWFDEDEDMEIGTIAESMEKDVVTTMSPKKEEMTQRKTGIEPMFPSVLKRKNAFDDDEAPVFGGGAATVLNQDKKIVIKVNGGDRSPSSDPASSPRESPSPGPSRDDEVSSSQNNSKENSLSPAPTVKSLVDYDESDSSDEEVPSADAVPSSSTGSPTSGDDQADQKSSSPEYNDVSSTSSEEKAALNGKAAATIVVAAPVDDSTRKRTSDGLDPVEAKRSRTEDAAATEA